MVVFTIGKNVCLVTLEKMAECYSLWSQEEYSLGPVVTGHVVDLLPSVRK